MTTGRIGVDLGGTKIEAIALVGGDGGLPIAGWFAFVAARRKDVSSPVSLPALFHQIGRAHV